MSYKIVYTFSKQSQITIKTTNKIAMKIYISMKFHHVQGNLTFITRIHISILHYIGFVQVQLRTEVLRIPSSTILGFALMTSTS